MTEKRFKMKKLEYESYFIDSQQEYVDEDEPNFKIDGEKTLSDSQILDLLNENEQLKSRVEYLERKIDRERTSYQKQHEKWEEEIQKENEQLKSKNRGLQSELQIFKEDATHSNLLINKLADENDQLKISSTMYHNLFKEFQRQMQGVKSIYDLDSKDFEDLIKLSKGNVFDDKIGWVHLPIKEL